ncbi:MAG: hypothetical protein VZQ83_07300 [Eubacterium sp.]|nr:hypothetical protein [Eubacterium sp.]
MLDEQLLSCTGAEEEYDCANEKELVERLGFNLNAEYFPSMKDGKITTESTYLDSTSFAITCDSFDKEKGEALVTLTGIGDYSGSCQIPIKLRKKAANPMKLKAGTASVKYSVVNKKAKTIKRAKVLKVSNAEGKLSFQYVGAEKGMKNYKSSFKVAAKTGNITIKKGLKKGTYKLIVKVKAAGNDAFKPSSWKAAIVTIKIK